MVTVSLSFDLVKGDVVFSYRDSGLATADHVAELRARMTPAEKVGQCMQLDAQGDLNDHMTRQNVGSLPHIPPDRMVRAMQLAAASTQGIPVLLADDCSHGHSVWPGATMVGTQWYVRDLVTSLTWADKELKGCENVDLGRGESVDVTFDLDVSARTIVDADGVRVVEPGDFEVLVGPGSRDTSLLDARFAVVP